MSIKLLSKYRTCLMAIAMIWIGCYHIYYGSGIKVIDFIVYRHGYFGVDIFVFLSGFGIYQSLKKSRNYYSYILKRIMRIFPYCIPIYIVSFIILKENFFYLLTDCLGLSILFRNSLINWFTSFIFIVYILSPLYCKLFEKKPLAVTSIFIICISVICLLIKNFDFVYIYFRTCIYILGFYFGYLYYCNINIKRKYYYIMIVFVFVGFLLIYILNHYYRNDITYVFPSIFIIPGLLLILSFIINKLYFIQKPLDIIGKYTYQFYLLHKIVLDFMTNNLYGLLYKPGIHFDFIFNHSTIVVSFVLAVLYKKIVDNIMYKCKQLTSCECVKGK